MAVAVVGDVAFSSSSFPRSLGRFDRVDRGEQGDLEGFEKRWRGLYLPPTEWSTAMIEFDCSAYRPYCQPSTAGSVSSVSRTDRTRVHSGQLGRIAVCEDVTCQMEEVMQGCCHPCQDIN